MPFTPEFRTALSHLQTRLRRRLVLRALSWALPVAMMLSAGLYLWLNLDQDAHAAISSSLKLDPYGPGLNLVVLILPMLIFAAGAITIGMKIKISDRQAALWADRWDGKRGQVSAAFEESPFQESLQNRAVEALSTAKERAYSSLSIGYRSLVTLLILIALWTVFFALPGLKDPALADAPPPNPLQDKLDPFQPPEEEPDLLNKISRALKTFGGNDTADTFDDISKLQEQLKNGELSKAEALAKLNKLQEKLKGADSSLGDAELLKSLSQNPIALKLAQEAMKKALGDSSLEDLLENGKAEELLKQFGEGSGLDPDTAKRLFEGMNEGSLLRDLLEGKPGALDEAKDFSDAKEEAGAKLKNLRKKILDPDAELEHNPNGRGLLRRLRRSGGERKKRIKSIELDGTEARKAPITLRTEVNEIAKGEDYISRPSKLPPHLERVAKRYFGKD